MSSSSLQGIAAAPGVAVGPAFVLHPEMAETDAIGNPGSPDEQQTRWLAARQRVVDALSALIEHARIQVGPAEAEIFDAQREMAADPELEDREATPSATGLRRSRRFAKRPRRTPLN